MGGGDIFKYIIKLFFSLQLKITSSFYKSSFDDESSTFKLTLKFKFYSKLRPACSNFYFYSPLSQIFDQN